MPLKFAHIFDGSDFKVAARDAQTAVRTMEHQGHPFFIGTAFRPERAALAGRPHPIISDFVSAAQSAAANQQQLSFHILIRVGPAGGLTSQALGMLPAPPTGIQGDCTQG